MKKFLCVIYTAMAFGSMSANAAPACKPAPVLTIKINGKTKEFSLEEVYAVIKDSPNLSKQPVEVAFKTALQQLAIKELTGSVADAHACKYSNDKELTDALSKLKEEMTRTYILQKVAEAQVNENEIKTEYNKRRDQFLKNNKKAYNISLIVLDSASKAKEVSDKLRAKGSFEELARNKNTDPALAKTGGIINEEIPESELPEKLRVRVASLADNAFDPSPVDINGNYFFVKKRSTVPATMRSFNSLRTKIKSDLAQSALFSLLGKAAGKAEIKAKDMSGQDMDFNIAEDVEKMKAAMAAAAA